MDLDWDRTCDWCDKDYVDGEVIDCDTPYCSKPEHQGWTQWCEDHVPDA